MKFRLSKKERLTMIIGVLLLLSLIVIAQFFLLTPLKSALEKKEQSLQTEQKILDTITQKKEENTNKVVEDTRELQKKVPVTPLQEQFILDLERAEIVSNSLIKSMSFSKDADVNVASSQPEEGNVANTSDTTQEGEQQSAEASTSGLKKLSISLSVESSRYEDLEKFVSTLESLNRIVVVDSINYTGGQEITSLTPDNTDEKLSYSLTVSAYYLPTLNDLIADLPKIDAPAPANKKNPLSVYVDVIDND